MWLRGKVRAVVTDDTRQHSCLSLTSFTPCLLSLKLTENRERQKKVCLKNPRGGRLRNKREQTVTQSRNSTQSRGIYEKTNCTRGVTCFSAMNHFLSFLKCLLSCHPVISGEIKWTEDICHWQLGFSQKYVLLCKFRARQWWAVSLLIE